MQTEQVDFHDFKTGECAGGSADGTYQALAAEKGTGVGRILLSKSMITDHLCTTYIAAVKSCISQLR